MDLKFYECGHCGKIAAVFRDSKASMMCCGEKMKKVVPAGETAGTKKPVLGCTVKGHVVTVTSGEVSCQAPVEQDNEWIAIGTLQGFQLKKLNPGDLPEAEFVLSDGDKVTAAYAYCGTHGLLERDISGESDSLSDQDEKDKSGGNYLVCRCNHVSYFDILDEIHRHSNMDDLMKMFDEIRNTTRCSTGCGKCYEKVMDIISEELMGGR